jgi:hypothetical protein
VVVLVALAAGLLVPAIPVASAAVDPVEVSVGAASVVEGDVGTRRVFFAVTLSRARSTATSVAYATSAVTAVGGTDFIQKAGRLTIPASTTTGVITVLVRGNNADDPATRSFRVTLSAPSGAVLGRAAATGAILDDDTGAASHVSIGSAAVVAGNADTSITFAITLDRSLNRDVSVAYATRSGSALAGIDFNRTTGRITIPAGSRSIPVAVTVRRNGGTRGGALETFGVRLSAPTGAVIGRAIGMGSIRREGYGAPSAWTQLGGNAGLTAHAATESTLSAANVSTVHQLWSVWMSGTERRTQPVSDGDAVYYVTPMDGPGGIYDGYLTAFDLDDAQVRWSVPTPNDDRQQNLAVSDGLVLASGRCGTMRCLRAYHASDGSLAWRYVSGVDPFTAAPTVANGIVYLSYWAGSHELDLATGKSVGGVLNDWDYQSAVADGHLVRSDYVYTLPSHQKLWYTAGPQVRVAQGGSVFGTYDGRLTARALTTGVEQWSVDIGCSSPSPPAVSPTAVVIQGCGFIRGFNRTTGAALWSPYVQRGQSDMQPSIANGLAFVNDESGFLTIINLATGGLAKEIDDTSNSSNGPIVVVDGKIVVSGYNLRVYGL